MGERIKPQATPPKKWKVVYEHKRLVEVPSGTTLLSFRHKPWTLVSFKAPKDGDVSGRVIMRPRGVKSNRNDQEFYPALFNLMIVKDVPDGLEVD